MREKAVSVLVVTCTKNPDVRKLKRVIDSVRDTKKHNKKHVIKHVVVDNNSEHSWWENDLDLAKYLRFNDVDLLFQKDAGKKKAIEKVADLYDYDYYSIIDDDNVLGSSDFFDKGLEIIKVNKLDVLGCCSRFKSNINLEIRSLAIGCQSDFGIGSRGFVFVNRAPWGAGTIYSNRVFNYYSFNKRHWEFVFNGRVGGSLISGEDCEIGLICNLLSLKMGVTNAIYFYHEVDLNRFSGSIMRKLHDAQETTNLVLKNYLDLGRFSLVYKYLSLIYRDLKFLFLYKELRNIGYLVKIKRNWCGVYLRGIYILLKSRKTRKLNLVSLGPFKGDVCD